MNNISKAYEFNEGQVTFTNLLGIVITLIVFFVFAIPVLTPLISVAVSSVSEEPNQFTGVMVTLLYAIPFVLLLAIIITALNYAIPVREGRY